MPNSNNNNRSTNNQNNHTQNNNYRGNNNNNRNNNYNRNSNNSRNSNGQGKWYIAYDGKDNSWFINPYQFVPLKEKCNRGDYEPGKLTGKITCTLTAHTPLAIPDAETLQTENGHKEYDFMSVNNTPFIPGSELRGMVRSVYEAVTNSCLSTLNDSYLHARAQSFIRMNTNYSTGGAGLLKKGNGKWKLYPVKFAKIIKDNSHKQCKSLFIKVSECNKGLPVAEICAAGDPGAKKGYLLKSERGLRTNPTIHDHVMYFDGKDPKPSDIVMNDADKQIQVLLDAYRDEGLNKTPGASRYYEGYSLSEDGYTPVFYRRVGDKYILSLAMQGREVYDRKLSDFAGDYAPCSSDKKLCPACALFGTARSGGAQGSRVRFSDAVATKDTLKRIKDETNKITLKPLLSPKVTATEFYTVGPNDAYEWNYMYYSKEGGNLDILPSDKLKLRGRKFYLHHKNLNPDEYQALKQNKEPDKTKFNSSMQLAPKGSEFTFSVYFDRITQHELNNLVWCLNPHTGTGNSRLDGMLKLGHGRALGLGSVKLEIKAIEQRIYKDGQYDIEPIVLDSTDTKKPGIYVEDIEGDVPGELKNILICEFPGVRYPEGADETARDDDQNKTGGHQWFIGNRKMNGTGTQHKVAYTLPNMPNGDVFRESDPEKHLWLPVLKKADVNNIPIQRTDTKDKFPQREIKYLPVQYSTDTASAQASPQPIKAVKALLCGRNRTLNAGQSQGKLSKLQGRIAIIQIDNAKFEFQGDIPIAWLSHDVSIEKTGQEYTIRLANPNKS